MVSEQAPHGGKINGLNEKQSKALRYYLATGEKERSAIDAGYSPKTAGAQMSRLLKNVKARAWLAEQRGEVEKKAQIELLDVVEQLGRMAMVDPLDLMDEDGRPLPLSDWPRDARLAVQDISVTTIGEDLGQVTKIRLADRNGAADKLMKFLGGYEKDNDQKNQVRELLDVVGAAASSRGILDAIKKRTRAGG